LADYPLGSSEKIVLNGFANNAGAQQADANFTPCSHLKCRNYRILIAPSLARASPTICRERA
jgi:hypothetical protein